MAGLHHSHAARDRGGSRPSKAYTWASPRKQRPSGDRRRPRPDAVGCSGTQPPFSATLETRVPLPSSPPERRTTLSSAANRTLSEAIHVARLAAFDLDLDRRMRDMEARFEIVDDGAQHLLPFTDALFDHQNVATAGNQARTDHPHVKVVHVEHTVRRSNRVNQRRHLDAAGGAFEQHRGALAEHAVAAPQN